MEPIEVPILIKRPALNWLANSRKARIALGAIVSVVLTRVLGRWFSAEDTNAITTAVVALGGVWIGSIAIEDMGTGNGVTRQSAEGEHTAQGSSAVDTAADASTSSATLSSPAAPGGPIDGARIVTSGAGEMPNLKSQISDGGFHAS